MLASRLHWRLLIGTVLVLMVAALAAPRVMPAPQLAENRVLAPVPVLPERLSEFRAFRKAVDDYVADHFPSRPHLIGGLNRMRMLAGVTGSERVIVGRKGWLFFDNGTHMGAVRNEPPLTPDQVRTWLTSLAGATETLQARGTAYLVVSPPAKEAIYPQFGPAWYRGPSPDRPAVTLPKLAKAAGAGEVIYLYDDVAAATRRGEKTYSLHDTHWTSYGAYAGYAGVIRKLQAMGVVKEPPLPLSAFTRIHGDESKGPRDVAMMLGVASFVDLDFPHFDYPQGQMKAKLTYLGDRQDWTGPQVIDTGEVGKPVLLMTRDSFSNEILPFFFSHFSRIVLAHNQDGTWRQDLIDQYKPDIVILEVIEAGLPVGIGGAPAPSAQKLAAIDRVVGAINAPAEAAPRVPQLKLPTAKVVAALAGAAPAQCNLEVATLARGQGTSATLTVGGWISEAAPHVTSPRGLLRLQGAGVDLVVPLAVDLPRPDVEAHYKMRSTLKSGFTGAFYLPTVAPGTYAATVYRRAPGGWIACPGREPVMAP